jgi:hypothetical protein
MSFICSLVMAEIYHLDLDPCTAEARERFFCYFRPAFQVSNACLFAASGG